MFKTLPITAIAAFVASAPAAQASSDLPGTEVRQTIVAIGDLDLPAAAGVATAERRIHRAADQICSADGNLLSPTAGKRRSLTPTPSGCSTPGLRSADARHATTLFTFRQRDPQAEIGIIRYAGDPQAMLARLRGV